MSSVKIQIIQSKDYSSMNRVLVDNKPIYEFGHSAAVEAERIRNLINALDLDNVEITDKERV